MFFHQTQIEQSAGCRHSLSIYHLL